MCSKERLATENPEALLFLVAMRCTLQNQVTSENECDVLIHSSFSILMSWPRYITWQDSGAFLQGGQVLENRGSRQS